MKTTLACFGILAASCSSTTLRMLPTGPAAAECPQSGDVLAKGPTAADAVADAKDRARNTGATHVLLVELDTDGERSYAYGRGFTCKENGQ